MYYSLNNILSHNCYLNILIGARGIGKTWSTKKYLTLQNIKKGYEFCYIRRTYAELKIAKKKFIKDLSLMFPDNKFKISDDTCLIDDRILCYFVPLSKSIQYKSAPMPNVKYILYDEFLLDKSINKNLHYLKDEPLHLINLIETIFRSSDDGKIFLLGNKVSNLNPYYTFFDIKETKEGINKYKDNLLLIEDIRTSDEYKQYKSSTKFGRLLAASDSFDSMINNVNVNQNNLFCVSDVPGKEFITSLKYDNKYYYLYKCILNNSEKIYIKRNNAANEGFCLKVNDVDYNYKYVNRYDAQILTLYRFAKNNLLLFDNISTKYIIYEILKFI